ncbi:hypothetical protein Tco_0093149 [Tanacetum coccineum]
MYPPVYTLSLMKYTQTTLFFHLFSDEMMSDVDVFRPGVLDVVAAEGYGTLVITVQRDAITSWCASLSLIRQLLTSSQGNEHSPRCYFCECPDNLALICVCWSLDDIRHTMHTSILGQVTSCEDNRHDVGRSGSTKIQAWSGH